MSARLPTHPVEQDLSLLEDDALLGFVRRGHGEAFAVLYERYRHPAHRLAAYLSNSVDAKDIVAESFTQVLFQINDGRGPSTSFRGYLFTAIRHEAGRRAKTGKRVLPTDEVSEIDRPVPFGHGHVDVFERDVVRAAFESLPDRWQTVLWHLEVDGAKPHELAPILGLTPNGVSALAYRAREGLRTAYLDQHLPTPETVDIMCVDVRDRLAGFVRGTATTRDVKVIDPHLDFCAACVGVYLELEEVNLHLGAVGGVLAAVFAAAPLPTVVAGLAAKASVLAKTAAIAAGSTAAVVATAITVAPGSFTAPAHADIASPRPHVIAVTDDRDLALVSTLKDHSASNESPDAEATSASVRSEATDQPALAESGSATPASPAAQQPSAPPTGGGGKPIDVSVNRADHSISVDIAGVKDAVNVDLRGVAATVAHTAKTTRTDRVVKAVGSTKTGAAAKKVVDKAVDGLLGDGAAGT